MVFFAEVLPPDDGLPGSERIATLKVLRNYKGARSPFVKVLFRDEGRGPWGRRGWRFTVGDKLLVFALGLSPDEQESAADARVTWCSMLPYYGRKGLHPRYWDLLANTSAGLR